MERFDTRVQKLKYQVLMETAKLEWEGRLAEGLLGLPEVLAPGKQPTMRCCVYKERAIAGERVKFAMSTGENGQPVIDVIGIACDECPTGGYEVSEACRGCLAHRCEKSCKFGAISFDENQKARIDKSKCKECGQCSKNCPYSAIHNNKRPCQNACKVKAITMDEELVAAIDHSKCTSCGACVYMCPFGAINDRSAILQIIRMLKEAAQEKDKHIYAVVAPSISSQFSYASLGQVISGLKELGFYQVMEAALGADMVALKEARELSEKGFLTSSCCPAFVTYVENQFPELAKHISGNLSPMAELGRFIKEKDEQAKVIFIGPCTAKKEEARTSKVSSFVDRVLTFEELQALIDSKGISLKDLAETPLEDASYYGRIFARSGGLSEAVKEACRELGLPDDTVKPVICDGIEQCRMALQKAAKGNLQGNFIEGMACVGGCIGGAGCLTHEIRDKAQVDQYGMEAKEKTISQAVNARK